ncbi:diaminopimelate epimerase [Rufibacter glacialis]|uniref:Diaminopimelate epimerase n=1 Tax=Rufibacter glacialis TaxID=1259555 RepID=A0A5M8QM85_9BACT|nr:diaminopimelate epimerase [Rufibacter glacialis]KAA6437337.1 diaminopimelate epimerase [Rufibacter glacialis]GGK60136.1 diaminopimelate epimerase [Rufibacter glacialis]
MTLTFYKYQGTGNDFVVLDNRAQAIALSQEQVAFLCDRRNGVGADGLMLLQNKEGYDFEMVYYNADGRPSSMCGNGGRCLVAFAQFMGVVENQAYFIAADGPHQAFLKDGLVHLQMKDVDAVEALEGATFLDTGSPHYVKQVEALQDLNVFAEGRAIRYSDRFKAEGTNVNFVEHLPENKLSVRTYERGVEDETFSCGTGVTACALAANRAGYESPISIQVLGGELQVSFEKAGEGFRNIYLIGPAQQVFKGEISL